MKQKNTRKIAVWLLAFAIILGLTLPPQQSFAAETTTATAIDDATAITNGAAVKGSFDQPDVYWYKVTPTKEEVSKYSHIKFDINSDQVVNVSVYPNKAKAIADDAFEQYVTGTVSDQAATISFPYAWEGPYYVKVEYSGFTDDLPMEGLSEDEGGSTDSVNYSITAKSVKLSPAKEEATGSVCPVEYSVAKQKSATQILKDIRLFRDGTLAKSTQGKQLSSLYYKAAPFLVAKMIFNKDIKQDVYKHLVEIQPLITDLNQNGGKSTRVISKSEANAIKQLFDIAHAAVPAKLQQSMDAIAKKVQIDSLAGEDLVAIAKNVGIKLNGNSASGKYIVKLKDGKTLKSVQSKISGNKTFSTLSTVDHSDELLDNTYVVEMDAKTASMSAKAQTKALQATVSQVEKLNEVEYVEPVQTYHALSSDVLSSYQWSLKNLGKNEGTKGADVQNDKLQSLLSTKKVKDTVIAVVDTGVDYTLADLKGHVDPSIGKNFVDETTGPLDDNGHGTHVAGIIAAEANNGYSIQGLDQHAKIMPVKVLTADGAGDTETIARGIKYAASHGAKVINLSLGGSYSRTLEAAMQYASSKGVAVIAASGNDGQMGISYPGRSRYAISVGATNDWDIVSDYSNFGEKLDLVAPGTNIPSLVPNGNVTYMSGTSMAAPHVAAVAGLLRSVDSTLSVSDIKTILHQTSKNVTFEGKDNTGEDGSIFDMLLGSDMDPEDFDLRVGTDLVSGYGRLNAFNAVSTADLRVKVHPILERATSVTGRAKTGSKVIVKKGSKVIGKATSVHGKFKVKIPAQKVNQHLTMTVTNPSYKAASTLALYVAKDNRPAAPEVKTITTKTTVVSGFAKPKLQVVMKNSAKKVIGKTTASKNAQFKIKLKKQKAGTKLYFNTVDSKKRTSKTVTVTVKKAKK